MVTISEKLCKLRGKYKVTNQQLADMTGIPIGTISGIMSGQVSSPSYANVCAILTALGEDIEQFNAGEDSPPPHKPDQIERLDHFQAKLEQIVAEAITRAYTADIVNQARRREKRLQTIIELMMLLIVAILIWDITHPNMGYVRY